MLNRAGKEYFNQMTTGLKNIFKPKRILKKNINRRIAITLSLMLIVGFGTSLAGLARAQIANADEFRMMAQRQQLSDTKIPAERGIIYDRNMTVLAQSATVWNVKLNPELLAKYPAEAKAEIFRGLESVLGVTQQELEEKASYTQYNSVYIKKKLEKPERDKMVEFLKKKYTRSVGEKKKNYAYSGVVALEEDVKRYYPYSALASQVIGCIGSDNNGLAGLEAKYDSLLTGVDGRIISAKANNSEINNVEYQSVYEAIQGTSTMLTIDETIQRFLDDALLECYNTSGCDACYGIVMDVKTGAILAMSNQAGFDPNNPYALSEKDEQELDKIKDETEKSNRRKEMVFQQWRNRAVCDTYEPGSVYKLFTLSAGLEENVVNMENTLRCDGRIQILDTSYWCHDHSGHGDQDATHALMNSCNPYFIQVGQKLGVDTFYKYFEAFGFTEATGIDLPGENVPKPGTTFFKREDMTKVNLASCSFGQSFQVSAIQMITAVNAIANGGKLMKPYVVAKTLDREKNVISVTEPTVKRQVISETTAANILSAMEQASVSGTAKNAYVSGYRVAGKTGTSDKLTGEKGDYIASFAGCAPANNPEISIIIVADKPQGVTGGGAVAAPVAAEVIENTLTYLNVERQYNDSEKEKLDKAVPNVVSSSVDSAEEALRAEGFKVKILGEGDTVCSQMPAYGQYVPQGGVVILYTEEHQRHEKVEVPDFSNLSVSDANYEAAAAGLNIRIMGNPANRGSLKAYKQSIEKGKKIEVGSTVTVYFRTTTGVTDH